MCVTLQSLKSISDRNWRQRQPPFLACCWELHLPATTLFIIFVLFAKVNTRGPQNPEDNNSVLEKENIIQKFLEIYRSGPKSNNNLWDMVKFEQIRREAAELQK